MKLSIAWIFDHIDADWRKIDIPDLVTRFNQTTAEIEGVYKVHTDMNSLFFAQVQEIKADSIILQTDTNKTITLSIRADAQNDSYYLIKKLNGENTWARGYDVGGTRDVLIPAIAMDDDLRKNWRQHFEQEDYILQVDNKSITNRPDMWGHRGFAREIAAILDLPLKPFNTFLFDVKVHEFENKAPASVQEPWAIEIEKNSGCNRLALNYIRNVIYTPSLLWMAHRLLRVDARAIDAIVDATNYVMLDIGQPMHAFDADKLPAKKIVVRRAYKKEKLTLLDEQVIELTPDDIVIADGKTPVSLVGVMGGALSGIGLQTKNILLESGHFDPTPIRLSAARHKVRTEASARFEKSLDPSQNIYAIQRFIRLMQDASIGMDVSREVISVGLLSEPKKIMVSHDFIEKRLGTSITPEFVYKTLNKLEFKVDTAGNMYSITVPTFRATKDINIKEDIVEEIGRFIGYGTIPQQMPLMRSKAAELSHLMRLRSIKNLLAYGMQMHELYNYAFYDESFLRQLNWQPSDAASVKDPVSENWQCLVTSLIPHMFKAVVLNHVHHEQLRFFEWGRVWTNHKDITETKKLAGILFDKKSISFYDGKALLHQLFNALDLEVDWQQVQHPTQPWWAPYQTAHIMYQGNVVGIAGSVDTLFFNKLAEGTAFIFELDGDFLINTKPEAKRYAPSSKYPEVIRDISMLVPLNRTFQELQTAVAHVDDRIVSIVLIDFFQKAEWQDQKSLAFRFVIRDDHKTLTKEEVDTIYHKVVKVLEKQGATIR